MSLVNDMLRDLDRRKGNEDDGELAWLTDNTGARAPAARRRRWRLLYACVALAVVAVLAWQYARHSHWWRAAEPLVDAQAAPAAAGDAPGASVVQLRGVRVQREADAVSVELLFDREPDFRWHREGNAAVVQLPNARGEAALLPSRLPRPLRSVQRLETNGDGLHLKLSADPFKGVDVALKPGENKRLRIRFGADPLPRAVAEAAASAARKGRSVAGALRPRPPVAEAAPKNAAPGETSNAAPATTPPPSPPAPVASQQQRAAPAPAEPQRSVKTARELTPAQQDRKVARQAQNLLREGDVYGAETLLADFIASLPAPERRSARLLASIWLQQKRYLAALNLIESLRERWPADLSLLQLHGRALLARGEPDAALALLREQRPALAAAPDYYELLAGVAQQAGEPALAARVYRELTRHDPGNGNWWAGLGIALEAGGEATQARQAYRYALQAGHLSNTLRDYARQRLNR